MRRLRARRSPARRRAGSPQTPPGRPRGVHLSGDSAAVRAPAPSAVPVGAHPRLRQGNFTRPPPALKAFASCCTERRSLGVPRSPENDDRPDRPHRRRDDRSRAVLSGQRRARPAPRYVGTGVPPPRRRPRAASSSRKGRSYTRPMAAFLAVLLAVVVFAGGVAVGHADTASGVAAAGSPAAGGGTASLGLIDEAWTGDPRPLRRRQEPQRQGPRLRRDPGADGRRRRRGPHVVPHRGRGEGRRPVAVGQLRRASASRWTRTRRPGRSSGP